MFFKFSPEENPSLTPPTALSTTSQQQWGPSHFQPFVNSLLWAQTTLWPLSLLLLRAISLQRMKICLLTFHLPNESSLLTPVARLTHRNYASFKQEISKGR